MTAPSTYHLFVYGSLRSGFKSPAYEYISRYFILVGPAKVRGKLFDLGEYPAGVPATGETFVVGELYRVKKEAEFSWAIGQLDDYEGMNTEAGENALYQRDIAEVHIEEHQVPAWVYWYRGDVSQAPLVPSGDILEYLRSKK